MGSRGYCLYLAPASAIQGYTSETRCQNLAIMLRKVYPGSRQCTHVFWQLYLMR